MFGLQPIVHAWKLFFYRWALREINPLHPDLPYIVHRLAELERSK